MENDKTLSKKIIIIIIINYFLTLGEEKGRPIGAEPWVNCRGKEELHSLVAATVGLTLRT